MLTNRKLGKSAIEISPIGLGTWQFSEAKSFHKLFWAKITTEDRTKVVETAVQNGINWFDTAEVYGFGASERGLRDSLIELNYKYPDIKIATKWSPMRFTARSISSTINKRLKNLHPFPITLHQIHGPMPWIRRTKEMDRMASLLELKLIEAVGVSNFSAKQMQKAYDRLELHGYQLSSNQVRYSVFDRRVENSIIPKAKELGMTIIAYSPLEQGLATGKYHKDPNSINNVPRMRRMRIKKKIKQSKRLIDEMRIIAEAHESTISQIALNWLITYHNETVVAIPGASKPEQAELNAKAIDIELSQEEKASIEELSQPFL